MKHLIFFTFLLLPFTASAQSNDFTAIDNFAGGVYYHAPDTLSKLLTQPYTTDLQKVRSIFYWITQHIAYDPEEASAPRYYYFSYHDHDDSLKKRKEMAKETVKQILSKRKGVCEDYAILFNTLCEYAKIKSVMVTGYSRALSDTIGKEKQDDHAWNAVMINNEWRLLDVTWASGYCDDRTGIFTKRFNDYYFLTPPEMMQLNHFPADSKWFLTGNPISLDDFFNLPTIYFDQTGNTIHNFTPRSGVINIKQGATIKFTFEAPDATKELRIVTYPNEILNPDYTASYMDKSHPAVAATNANTGDSKRHYIQSNNDVDDIYNYLDKQKKSLPVKTAVTAENYTANNKTVVRNYVVTNPRLQSITIIYDDEPILKYSINIIR